MKLVFCGSGAFGATMLRALVDGGFAPALVVTRPLTRRRRRGHAEPTPAHAVADERGLDVFTPPNVNAPEALDRLRAAAADLFVVSEYGQILKKPLLAIPPLGTINVHTSLLPRWRGATPVAAAILAGDTETGITIQRTVRKLDAGPILAARAIPVRPDDTTETLTARLEPVGSELLLDVVAAFARGEPPREEPQDESAVTICTRLSRDDGRVDWAHSAASIERMIRAFHPWPGAHTDLLREPPLSLDLLRAEARPGAAPPGEVAAAGRDGFDVGTGDGLLRVLELKPASRRAMAAHDFVNGYRLAPGERLGG